MYIWLVDYIQRKIYQLYELILIPLNVILSLISFFSIAKIMSTGKKESAFFLI